MSAASPLDAHFVLEKKPSDCTLIHETVTIQEVDLVEEGEDVRISLQPEDEEELGL